MPGKVSSKNSYILKKHKLSAAQIYLQMTVSAPTVDNGSVEQEDEGPIKKGRNSHEHLQLLM